MFTEARALIEAVLEHSEDVGQALLHAFAAPSQPQSHSRFKIAYRVAVVAPSPLESRRAGVPELDIRAVRQAADNPPVEFAEPQRGRGTRASTGSSMGSGWLRILGGAWMLYQHGVAGLGVLITDDAAHALATHIGHPS